MKHIKTVLSTLGLAFTLILFTACSNKSGVAYDYEGYKQIKEVIEGKVIEVRNVYIKDDGTGKIIGAIAGTVLGSTIGKGDGSTLAALGGAILGGVVGNEINKSNAQELTVTLDSKKTIVVISKETQIAVGDKIRIIKVDNEIQSVYKI